MINIAIYNRPSRTKEFHVPLARCLFETYHNEFGKKPQDVNWITPLDMMEDDELFATLERTPPDVLGISCYIWNNEFAIEIAKQVKERWPNCLIISGGPNQIAQNDASFFSTYPFIDAVLEPGLNGEWFITDVLDQLTDGEKVQFSKVTGAIYALGTNKTAVFKSPKFRNAKEFTFTSKSVYSLPWLIPYVEAHRPMFNTVVLAFETTRGCPYSCSFCEWGKDSHSKVVAKNMNTIVNEIRDIAELRPDVLRLIDSNFGQLPRDIQVASELGEVLFAPRPHKVVCHLAGVAKNNKKNLFDIFKILVESKAQLSEYRASVQDLDSRVTGIVNRIDLPFDEHIDLVKRIKDELGLKIALETITGLPGKTLDSFYNDFDIVFEHFPNNYRPSYSYFLLQGTPAAEPAFMEKHAIDATALSTMDFQGMLTKREFDALEYFPGLVTSTATYSKDDWTKMLFSTKLVSTCLTNEHLSDALLYIREKYDISVGQFFRKFVDVMFTSTNPFAGKLTVIMNQIITYVNNGRVTEYVLIPEIDSYMGILHTINYYIMTMKGEFAKYVCEVLRQFSIANEDEVIEMYCRQTLDTDYDPRVGRTITIGGVSTTFVDKELNGREIHEQLSETTAIWHCFAQRSSFKLKVSI